MKKMYRFLGGLLAVLVLSISTLPLASALFTDTLYYYGTVENIVRNEDGTIDSLLVSSAEDEDYQMLISKSTQWKDHDAKSESDPDTLTVGEEICVVHSSAVMMSLPPQSAAYTVIRNFPQGTDLEQEARRDACPIRKFLKKAKQNLSDWFYQARPIGE